VFPEATISRSFELKEFKAGAARMAQAAGVPIVPTIVWGGPAHLHQGPAARLHPPRQGPHRGVRPAADAGAAGGLRGVTAELRRRMSTLLDQVRSAYPDTPAGDDDRWWLPASMGGTAPTLAEATALDEAEAAARRAAKARRDSTTRRRSPPRAGGQRASTRGGGFLDGQGPRARAPGRSTGRRPLG
jgi:hypothetical protein